MTSTPTTLPADKSSGAVSQKALWLMIAIALNAAELAVPRLPFLPWLKPGFANVVTILWIIKFGFRDAALYTALRIWISGFYFGFSLFTFSLSLAGGLLSTAAMSLLWASLGKRGWAGTLGIAVTGALFHNAGQLGVVYFIMDQNMTLLSQIPFMLAAAIVFGGAVGLLAPATARIIGFYDDDDDQPSSTKNTSDDITISHRGAVSMIDIFVVSLTFAVSILLMFIGDITILASAAVLFSLISSVLNLPSRKNRIHSPQHVQGVALPGEHSSPLHVISVFFYPLKFYILFLFIAFTHLFFSYGTRLESIPFVTREGLTAFTAQSLRMWCWLQTVHIFNRFHFGEMFIGTLRKLFPNKHDTLEAGMTAMKHFPEIVRVAKSGNKKRSASAWLFNPKAALTGYVCEMRERIERVI